MSVNLLTKEMALKILDRLDRLDRLDCLDLPEEDTNVHADVLKAIVSGRVVCVDAKQEPFAWAIRVKGWDGDAGWIPLMKISGYVDLEQWEMKKLYTTPQPPSAGEWMPIETAPMDGTEILGFRSDAGWFLVRWTCLSDFEMESENHKYSTANWEAYDWFYADFVAGGRLDPSEYPTHWMPLPGAQKP